MPDSAPIDNARALDALLAHIERERARRREALLDAARREARALEAAARGEANRRVRQVVARERARRDERLQRARAEAAAQRRERRQVQLRHRLDEARARLGPALEDRWRDSRARRRWIHLALQEALWHLTPGTWRVQYPPGLDSAELERARRVLARVRPDVRLACAADPALAAGLRITQGAAQLDTGIAALLRSRARVEGLLRAALSGQLDASRRDAP
ncbi:MAG TPA: hypothetical protein VFA95_11455 [Gammaproteobacteria bacterium]|nr:hypothetical protein [Gammaproteobacteria bacterium]